MALHPPPDHGAGGDPNLFDTKRAPVYYLHPDATTYQRAVRHRSRIWIRGTEENDRRVIVAGGTREQKGGSSQVREDKVTWTRGDPGYQLGKKESGSRSFRDRRPAP